MVTIYCRFLNSIYRFRSLLSLTNLIIKHEDFDLEKLDVHLEQFNKSFTTKSFKLKKQTKIFTFRQLKINECKNYDSSGEGECDSQQNCIDQCYRTKFLASFHGLPGRNSVIYPGAYPKGHKKILSLFLDGKEDKELWRNCSETYNISGCQSIVFGNSFEENKFNRTRKELVIDPFFFQVKQGTA